MKKALLISTAVFSLGLASVLGVGLASAQSNNNGDGGLVDKIAKRFNLKSSDVQKVFDEDRASHQAERLAQIKTDLDQAVKDGKITQKQEDVIIAKHKEMQSYIESLKDKTPQERRTLMDAKRDELKKWASENNVAEQYVIFGGREGHGMGHRGDKDL
jgi:hypothetical protein